MNRPFKSGLLIAVGLTAVLALSSCSMLRQYLPGGHDQSAQSSQSAPDASSVRPGRLQQPEERGVHPSGNPEPD